MKKKSHILRAVKNVLGLKCPIISRNIVLLNEAAFLYLPHVYQHAVDCHCIPFEFCGNTAFHLEDPLSMDWILRVAFLNRSHGQWPDQDLL